MDALTDRELLSLQIATLLMFDRHGRIEQSGPRVFVGRTVAGERLVRVRCDIPEAIARRWLAAGEDEELRALVSEHAPIEREYRGPAYQLPASPTPDEGLVAVGPGTPLHPELIARGWKPVETPPYLGALVDGQVVACCFSARSTEQAAEAGVETASEFRGRGLGEAVARGWAAAVQETGRVAFYSTTWDNKASQRIAEKLGGRLFGEDWHLT